jgi:cellulose synthase/poly-beta-1,6-N-acetylglucosamine synthase-like glycosyltransferase
LNAAYSPLTRSQALALDGHFVVEQAGRQAGGFPIGFNGSGGIWRRACIDDPAVGGWHADTLCEDLDLSYRAQLAGWQPCFLSEVEAPAEIPPQLAAFKRQQFRWAKGSIQTLRKVGGRVWHSDWPLLVRLTAVVHLGNYLIHPLLLLILLVSLPLLLTGQNPGSQLALLSLASFGPPLLYAVAQVVLHGRQWWRQWRYLPLLTLLGTGLCFNNTLAVWQGVRNQGGVFLRTPKFRLESRTDGWQRSAYRLPLDSTLIGETFLLLYAIVTVIIALTQGHWTLAAFLLIYVGGFALMVGATLWQARPQPAQAPAAAQQPKSSHPVVT